MTKNKGPGIAKAHNRSAHLLIGVVAGGLIGASAALLFAPKAGKKLRRDLYEAYEDISEKTQDFAEGALKNGQRVMDVASSYAEKVKETASDLIEPESDNFKMNLLIAAIGGGVLGATAIYMFASPSENAHEKSKHSYPDVSNFAKIFEGTRKTAVDQLKSIDWYGVAKNVLNTLHPEESEEESEGEEGKHHPIEDVMELAVQGMRVWQNIKKGR